MPRKFVVTAAVVLACSSAAHSANQRNLDPGNGTFEPWDRCQWTSAALLNLSPGSRIYPYHHCNEG